MHKRILIILIFTFITLCVTGQVRNRYRVWLTDKAENTHNIEQPETFLSTKAIERRTLRNIEITEQDLPVSSTYIQQIKELGFNIVTTSRWMNTVVIAPGLDVTIDTIYQLPFVKKVECVQNDKTSSPFAAQHAPTKTVEEDTTEYIGELESYYGAAWEQINQLNLAPLHQEGYCGNGMTIAVLDAGFYCVNQNAGIDMSQVIGTHDFTRKSFNYINGVDHGSMVLICMATNVPNTYIGTAPEANYWLMITEDNNREFPIEEDYWVAGAEMADSVGADIITSSLGYYIYDDPDMSYTHEDLDGQTAFCSRGATIAASKGMLVVTAAGNEYGTDWNKIVVPGDANGVLTVGGVSSDGTHSEFSSIGYTADGRVKPDVVARATRTKVLHTDGMIASVSGTSYSTPLMTGAMACLWQAHPEWSVAELIDRVQRGASQYYTPDEFLGYGIPDIYGIHCDASDVNNTTVHDYKLYTTDNILYLPTIAQSATISIYDTCGRMVWNSTLVQGTDKVDLGHIEKGIYIVTVTTNDSQKAQKIIIR